MGVGVTHGGDAWFGAQIGGLTGTHGGLSGPLPGDGLHGYGAGVGVGQNGVGVKSMHVPMPSGGLIGVSTAHGGLLRSEPGDGLHG
jgi:hypothetical protein